MHYMLLIHVDQALVDALPEGRFDAMMRECFGHADELRDAGHLLESQQLQPPATARSIRVRNGQRSVVDGPYAEARELFGGFNLIEARDMDEAVRIASGFPWAQVGRIEVREVRDLEAERRRVGA